MDDQQRPQQKRSAGFIVFIIGACASLLFALLSLGAPIWGYLFIWGDGWTGTPFELFISNQFPLIGFLLGCVFCILCLVGFALTRVKQRSVAVGRVKGRS